MMEARLGVSDDPLGMNDQSQLRSCTHVFTAAVQALLNKKQNLVVQLSFFKHIPAPLTFNIHIFGGTRWRSEGCLAPLRLWCGGLAQAQCISHTL
jgi:hypothetical protein